MKDIGADALICFPFSNDSIGWVQSEFIFPFRDKLIEKISNATNLFLLKYEGEPTNADSWLLFLIQKMTLFLGMNSILNILLDSGPKSLKQKSIKNLKEKSKR